MATVSPRRSLHHALQTRHAILQAGVVLASVDGLEPLSLARLADETGLSKSGVAGHFGSKETLQLGVLAEAGRIFRREITVPAQHCAPGLARLHALGENWLGYLDRGVFPGGCFFTGVTAEFDGRGGPVRDAIATANRDWRVYLAAEILTAVDAGELPADTDPEQLVFELMGLMLSLNHSLQLDADPTAVLRARTGLRRLLGSQNPRRADSTPEPGVADCAP